MNAETYREFAQLVHDLIAAKVDDPLVYQTMETFLRVWHDMISLNPKYSQM